MSIAVFCLKILSSWLCLWRLWHVITHGVVTLLIVHWPLFARWRWLVLSHCSASAMIVHGCSPVLNSLLLKVVIWICLIAVITVGLLYLLFLLKYLIMWNCCDGNKLHAINPTVGVTKQNGSLSQRDAIIINRLQIGHVCYTCTSSWWWRRSILYDLLHFTVNHILIKCPQFNHLRQRYHFGSKLKDLFYDTSVNDTIAFIKDTHFDTRI